MITNLSTVTEDQQTLLKAVQYSNYLHHSTLEENEGVSAANLLKLSKALKYNPEDDMMRFSSEAELEDHRLAFEQILVFINLTIFLTPKS